MSEHTQTLWVIFQTPKKNLLTKISSLQAYGRLKIDELKVSYGKKKDGDWLFRIAGEPRARTFSFHDGDAIAKQSKGYVSLRRYSVRSIWIFFMMICAACTAWELKNFHSSKQIATAPIPKPIVKVSLPVTQPKIPEVVADIADPKIHKTFLESKRQFQYGQLQASFINLKKNFEKLNGDDQKEASGMIAEMYFLQCENWMRQHEQRKAVIHCEKAIHYSPNEKAQRFLNTQDEKARKLYLEGYTVQKFDPKSAKQKYALVMQTSPTKSSWRGKAQYQLRKLQ